MAKKVILITGASGALGAELAEYFSEKDFALALHHNQNEISISETADIKHFKTDLQSEQEIEKLIEKVVSVFGRIDVVINNAGVSKSAMSWKTKTIDWAETIALNLTAPFHINKFATPHLRKQKWGRIINISSVVAQTGFVGTVAYASSKAGLIGMTKTLSQELASSGITVNALALGYFNTGMIDDVPESLRQDIIDKVPTKQLGEPKTIAQTIELLISDSGEFITGQTINLNGGLYS